MNDIIDIYEPVYTPPNYLLIILTAIAIITLIAGLVIFLIKIIKNRTCSATEKYKEALNSFLFIKGEIGKLNSKEFLKKCNITLLTFLEYSLSNSYDSLTSFEFMKMLETKLIDKSFINSFFPEKYDLILFGKYEIGKEERLEILKNYGEITHEIYKSDIHD